MYADYNGIKQSLTSDDIAGIQSVWGAPQPDQYNSNGHSNANFTIAANITSLINNGQIAIPSLRITSSSQSEWFSVTVPSSTTGTMVVTDQSSNLSMLSPSLWVYSSGTTLPVSIGSVSSTAYGATVSYAVSGVQPGQTYFIRAYGNAAANPTGAFGLEVNFGSATQAPIAPPNTVVPQEPNQGGGIGLLQAPIGPQPISIGNLSGQGIEDWMNVLALPNIGGTALSPSSDGTGVVDLSAITPIDTTQTDQAVATCSSDPTLAAQTGLSSSGTIPSTLQAIDQTILDWNLNTLQSLLT